MEYGNHDLIKHLENRASRKPGDRGWIFLRSLEELDEGPGYPGTCLDGYSPKTLRQVLASARGFLPQIWRVRVDRECLLRYNSITY